MPFGLLREGGVTPSFGLYGDVPLDRVWFFGLAVLSRVYNYLNRAWYYEPRDFNPDCKQSLSFPSLREVRLKEHAIERQTTSGAFLLLIDLHNINWVKPTVTRTLQCHQSTSDHFPFKNAIVVGIL